MIKKCTNVLYSEGRINTEKIKKKLEFFEKVIIMIEKRKNMQVEINGVNVDLTQDQIEEMNINIFKEEILETINGCKISIFVVGSSSEIYFNKKNKILFSQSNEKKFFYINELFFSHFKSGFNPLTESFFERSPKQIREAFKDVIEEYLGLNGFTVKFKPCMSTKGRTEEEILELNRES